MGLLKISKALSNEKRIKIIAVLLKGDFCQVHLEKITNIKQVDISKHCKILKDAQIITSFKIGNRTIYNINPNFLKKFPDIANQIKLEEKHLINKVNEQIKKKCNDYEK